MENCCTAEVPHVDSIPPQPKGRNWALTSGTLFTACHGHTSPKPQWTRSPVCCKTSPESPHIIKRNKYQMITPLIAYTHPAEFNHGTWKVIFEVYRMQIQVSSKSIRSDWNLLWSKYLFKKVTAGVIILARLSMHSAVRLRLPRAGVHSECLSVTLLKKKIVFFKSKEGH